MKNKPKERNEKRRKDTLSGRHIWIDDVWNILTGEKSGSIEYTFPYKHIRCLACGIINDL